MDVGVINQHSWETPISEMDDFQARFDYQRVQIPVARIAERIGFI